VNVTLAFVGIALAAAVVGGAAREYSRRSHDDANEVNTP
jgi:hypothetical protein